MGAARLGPVRRAGDLLLVAAMGMLLNLTPVVLNHDFRFTPLAVGSIACWAVVAIPLFVFAFSELFLRRD